MALLLIFSFMVVFGSLALAFDSVRYFTLQSKMENAARAAVIFAAHNRTVLSDEIVNSLSRKIAELEIEGSILPSFNALNVHLDQFSLDRSNDGVDIHVTVVAKLPTTFMQAFNSFDDIDVSGRAIARSTIEDLEIVFLLDRSETVGISGKLTSIVSSVGLANQLIETLSHAAAHPAKIGIVPFGNTLTNVAPYRNWVEIKDWPTDIPPDVPGKINWSGPLENQRWCVEGRVSALDPELPPAFGKFPLVLSIHKETGATPDQDVYSVDTTEKCTAVPIWPLQAGIDGMSSYFSSIVANGQTATGSAMVWAERVLSPRWRQAWDLGEEAPVNFDANIKKAVVLISASTHRQGLEENQRFDESCKRMNANNIQIYVVDFEGAALENTMLKDCATTVRHYFLVKSGASLTRSIKDIIKSLISVEFIDLGA